MITIDRLDDHTLCMLAGWDATLLVSVYVPVDFSRARPEQAITNALRSAARTAVTTLTVDHGMDSSVAASFVAPLTDEALVVDVPNTARGLAVFLSSERALHLALPIEVGPAVVVGDRLDLLRLLPAFVDDIDYFALTIDKNGAQLFRGSRFDFVPVPVAEMPGSIGDALWYIRRQPVLNRHGSGVIHGGGGGQDLRKDDVRQYIHLIDKAITPALRGADAPLVVVGVEYEAAMFINHTHYRHTVDIPISGSPESMQRDELHRRSWEFVRSQSRVAHDALKQLRQLAGTGKTATDPDEVVAASRHGSVGDLLVARSVTEGSETTSVSAAERRTIALAVNEGLRHRALIHLVDDDTMPGGIYVAAVLRY